MPGGKSRELYVAAKTSTELQMTKIAASPASLPKIDWEQYKRILPGVAMVQEFQAGYEALDIPYPIDAANKLGDAVVADVSIKAVATEVSAEVDEKCADSKKDIAFFQKLPPALTMTYEMYLELFPNAHLVVPKERETLEAELAETSSAISEYQAKKA